MKNIHVLPTEKPSRLFVTDGKLFNYHKPQKGDGIKIINQNIYITSDEPAYPYALHLKNREVFKTRAVGSHSLELYHDKGFSYPEECKKIIITTDPDLIKDGVQAIDDEFLEWFVKNPSCERVEVVLDDLCFISYNYEKNYKIIIPKEEPKQTDEKGSPITYWGGLEESKQGLEKEMFELEQELDIPSNLRWHNSKPKQETLEEAIKKEYKFRIGSHSFTNPVDIGGQEEIIYSKENMKTQESRLQEIKVELDNSNSRLYNLSNELYEQTANLCGEFIRPITTSLENKKIGDFYLDIFNAQIGFQIAVIEEIENTLKYLKNATNKI
jgi:hypothetical protein